MSSNGSRIVLLALLLTLMLSAGQMTLAQDVPPAEIVNDEGGPVIVNGTLTYTNAFFTAGVAEPVVILEDQAGFVDRNKYYIFPVESQVLGKFTSNFYESPVDYTLSLPQVPQGSPRDVDNDDETDPGVQIFAVAYWTNTWGDPYLEERDLYGGGWSGAYASTIVSQDADTSGEVLGGQYIVYAPDDEQGFPSGFGDDGLLFTEDDPIVTLPAGYTLVDMNSDPFIFDRSREPVVDLIEPSDSALIDFSDQTFTEAFDSMVQLFRERYAFTEYKNLDWDALSEEFRPIIQTAEAAGDFDTYVRALRDFYFSIPDGHMRFPLVGAIAEEFAEQTAGGLGFALVQLDDGRIITNFVTGGAAADQAGIEVGAEILEINGQPIDDAVSEIVPASSPFSTDETRRLQQLRYITRYPLNTDVEVTYQNPGDTEPSTVTLTTTEERESFSFSSFNQGVTEVELPLEYELLPNGYMVVKIYSFFDNQLLTIQLWERMIQALNTNGIRGLIIDMRQNGGGSGFLANQMAAYFFDEQIIVGNTAVYDEKRGEFYSDERGARRFYLPPENLRYNGPITVLIGPNCNSACEFFTYSMTQQERAEIVGQYATAGLGGGQNVFVMPGGLTLQFSAGRSLDAEGEIVIEGTGVAPTIKVPITEETVLSGGDPVLDAAVEYLNQVNGF
jgi:C-terminal processing protease CtpA/Prc